MGDVIAAPTRHKLSVDEYERMVEVGVFGPEDRIELVNGELIDMAPIGEGHAAVVTALTEALSLACVGRAHVSPQNPVLVDRFSEPQPDFAVLRRRADFYAKGRPKPGDVLLLVEVADSSLRFDRTVKLPLYAKAGIAEFWIVDLKRRVVDTYRQPGATGYGEVTTYQAGDQVALALMPEIVVKLDLVFA